MKKVFCFGEVLWDNLVTGRRIGGAPLNVCYHLSKNNIQSYIISQIGADSNGKELLSGLHNLAVDTRYITQSVYPTSTVEVHLLENTKVEYEIVEEVAWDYIPYSKVLAQAISESDAFVFGSLAVRNTESRRTLFKYAEHARWRVFDINLREPFYSKEIIEQLIISCHTMKINDDELIIIAKWFQIPSDQEQKIIDTLFTLFPDLKEIILTKGACGAAYYSRDLMLEIDAISVQVKDTVGSGDSFLAAFIAHRLHGDAVYESLQAAVLLSAYVATRSGGCPSYSAEDINTFKNIHHYE